jgi:hypothetical protein
MRLLPEIEVFIIRVMACPAFPLNQISRIILVEVAPALKNPSGYSNCNELTESLS